MPSAEPPDLTGTPYRLLERTAHGEFGAWRASDTGGNRYVVKTSWSEAGREAAGLLNSRGYPAPRYVFVRPGLCVQEELPGLPIGEWKELPPWAVECLLALNEALAGVRIADSPRWPERLLDEFGSYNEWIDLTLLERHSEAGATVLRRCRELAHRFSDELHDTGDLVHWDYTTDNILAVGEEVTGVVDWDGALNGDRLFDVATLWYYTRTPALRTYALARTSEEIWSVYAAHIVLRQTAWSMRLHDPAEADRLVRDALELTETFPA